MTPGRKFSTITSMSGTSFWITSRPSAVRSSSVMLRLPRLSASK